MTRATRWGLGLVLLLAACKEEPSKAYDRLVFFAKMGNEEAFLDGFTERSRPLVRTVLALRRTYGDDVNKDSDPYLALVMDEVESTEIETQSLQRDLHERTKTAEEGLEKVERRVATLTVKKGPIKRRVKMIELKDGWKIDAFDLQELWQKDPKAFSSRD